MAVSTENTLIVYTGNESDEDAYPVTFRVLEAEHVKVGIRENPALVGETPFEVVDPGDYEVTLDEETGLASVVTDTAYDTDTQVGIWREVAMTQEREYPAIGPFPSQSHEEALDKLTMLVQQLSTRMDRCLELRSNDAQDTPGILPVPTFGLTGFDADNIGKIYTFSEAAAEIQPSYLTIVESADNPTPETLEDGKAVLWRNTSQDPSIALRIWANVGGNLYNVLLGDAGA